MIMMSKLGKWIRCYNIKIIFIWLKYIFLFVLSEVNGDSWNLVEQMIWQLWILGVDLSFEGIK